MLDIAIIGAGPYGLSLASQMNTLGLSYRIFGKPMELWSAHMPPGMSLKSDRASSDLIDPQGILPLARFHAERGESFKPEEVIALDSFVAYGLAFQKRLVPTVETVEVVSVAQDGEGYSLRLSTDEVVHARRVVVAVGVYPFRYLPPVFAALPPSLCSHSGEYGPIDQFRGKKVAVIGSGASAIDLALSLAEHGTDVTLISRRPEIRFQAAPSSERISWLFNFRRPNTGIGRGWRIKFYADMPHLVRLLPAKMRARILRNTLGPQPGWVMKERIAGRFPILSNQTPRAAAAVNGKAQLTLDGHDGTSRALEFDHVIGATGYRTDIEKLPFLAESIRKKIRTHEGAPELSGRFESSCSGLYFIGPAAGMSFGPVMRFVFGAGFTIKTMVKHLAQFGTPGATPRPVIAPAPVSNKAA